MGFQFIFIVLFIVSVLTTLTVQGIKYILDTNNKNYSANILAVIVSVLLSGIMVFLYCLYFSKPFTTQIVIETVVLMYLSFLVATNGYDKIVQTIRQIENKLGKDILK
ncbi:MAG: hypothetical protein J1E41_04965 [Ruminococcus sp.]|nr:hypothetical protein [Ruminococcus sp.]